MPVPSRTTILSALRIVDNLWAITIVVLSFEISSNAAWISFSVFVSRADVASSKIRIGEFLRIALAMEILCFCPPERRTPRSPIMVS